MSANTLIEIKKTKKGYEAWLLDADTGSGNKFAEAKSLRKIIDKVNLSEEYLHCEYGIHFYL